MKQPKKLTRNQKRILDKRGYIANEYALLKEDNISFTIIKKDTINDISPICIELAK